MLSYMLSYSLNYTIIWFILQSLFLSVYTKKKFGVETIFTQKLLVNFPNNYKEMASNS